MGHAVLTSLLSGLLLACSASAGRAFGHGRKLQSTWGCGHEFPWVPPAVTHWSEVPYKSAAGSTQTTAEALETIRGVRWGDYHPGSEEVILEYNATTSRVDMHVKRLSPPNQPYKPVGMLSVLRRAVERYNKELVMLLKDRKAPMHLIMQTEDFPIVAADRNYKLPAFSMCSDPGAIDYPVPDFTFEEYPEAKYSNSSWWAIRDLLILKSRMLHWKDRKRAAFMRHHAGVGFRKTLVPLLVELQANKSDILGMPLDVADTGFVASNQNAFMYLDEACMYRYTIHTAGFSYSAGLKYKLACGTVTLFFQSKYREFYYRALKPGHHMIAVHEGDEGQLRKELLPKLAQGVRQVEEAAGGPEVRPDMSYKAQELALHVLSHDSLSCYWLYTLTAYSHLYYAERKEDIPAVPVLR